MTLRTRLLDRIAVVLLTCLYFAIAATDALRRRSRALAAGKGIV